MDKKETFVEELAKQLPVKEIYDDLAHPMLSTVGQSLQGVTKLALAPISALVWGYDKIASYLDIAIPEYFAKRKIAKEKIVSPDPVIAVPVVEAMRYTSHREELREMFTNLLGASMCSDSVDEHPAFVEIIKQLSPDECKMIKYMQKHIMMPMLKVRIKVDGRGEYDIAPYFSDICYIVNCVHPNKFPEYLDNLHRLGLVEVHYDRFITNEKVYFDLKQHPAFPQILVEEDKKSEKNSLYELSEFGKKFCKICLG